MAQYRVPVLEQFSWQPPVASVLSTPPGSPAKGDRYLVGASPTGAWSGKTNNIAWYDGAAWMFDAPSAGWTTYNVATSMQLTYGGSVWANLDGDMTKAVYDTNNNGIVDKAESIDDGAGHTASATAIASAVTNSHVQGTDQGLDTGGANATTAAQVKSAVTNSHVQGTDQGLDTGGANATTAAQVKSAVTKSHDQNKDQYLDQGGANQISAAQAKQAYDREGSYDSALKVILFNM